MRARRADSPLLGLLWYDADQKDFYDHVRHDCDERDKLSRYGWRRHDGAGFGAQELVDGEVGLNLTTSFVLTSAPGARRQMWRARITGNNVHTSASKSFSAASLSSHPRNVSLVWYVAAPRSTRGKGEAVSIFDAVKKKLTTRAERGIAGRVVVDAVADGDGDGARHRFVWSGAAENKHPVVEIAGSGGRKARRLSRAYVAGVAAPVADVWNVKPLALQQLKQRLHLMRVSIRFALFSIALFFLLLLSRSVSSVVFRSFPLSCSRVCSPLAFDFGRS
jgi:hypothetical protein